jgi:hypothetical protein
MSHSEPSGTVTGSDFAVLPSHARVLPTLSTFWLACPPSDPRPSCLQVLLHELDAVRKACAYIEADYQPPVTFIVVQKRHHTRLYPTDSMTDRSENIVPGTVVDSSICHPTDFDFFLCSHAGIQVRGLRSGRVTAGEGRKRCGRDRSSVPSGHKCEIELDDVRLKVA